MAQCRAAARKRDVAHNREGINNAVEGRQGQMGSVPSPYPGVDYQAAVRLPKYFLPRKRRARDTVSLQIRENVPLAPLTTMGVGGPARFLAVCGSRDEICEGLSWAAQRGVPVQVLGGGSNTIFADEGFEGLVLVVGMEGVQLDDDAGSVRVTAAAGEDWDGVVEHLEEPSYGNPFDSHVALLQWVYRRL